jgi:transcriptional regulator with XRE-family HTH domain
MGIKISQPSRKVLEKIRGRKLTFGKMLQSLRKCDEISQANLAHNMGISPAYLCDVEKGRRIVSPHMASQFAKVMGYSAIQFVAVAIEDTLQESGLHFKVTLEAA